MMMTWDYTAEAAVQGTPVPGGFFLGFFPTPSLRHFPFQQESGEGRVRGR